MIKCGECGYENMDGLDYCDGCGAKVSAPAGAPAAEAATSAPVMETGAEAGAAAAAAETAAQPADETAGAESAPAAEPAPETAPAQAQPEPEPAPAAAALVKVKLTIVRGGRQGQEFSLESGNNVLGRWDPETGAFPEVDMEADDPEAKISRKHALVRIDGAKVTVEDIGSLNGTYVNRGPRLQPGAPVELKSGDEIIVGKTFFKITIDPVS